jgi:V/A-type H+-transporting ATPase subunit B
MAFGDSFEQDFLTQEETDNRSIEETLDLGWKTLTALPRDELYRVKEEYIGKYLPQGDEGGKT